MIDLCLHKEPQKRPSAEKLLAHAFFKSAKKPQYLVTTLLQGLTPITERKHLNSRRILFDSRMDRARARRYYSYQ